jgi:hypothetical protein
MLPLPAGRTRSMWGLVPGCTSSRTRGLTEGVDAVKRRSEILHHFGEPGFKRSAPPRQHVIVAGAKRCERRNADKLAQAPPYAVAFHGIADLLRYCKSDPRRSGFGAPERLQDKGACRRSRASCCGLGSGPKVTSAFQPLHEIDIRTDLNRIGTGARLCAARSAQALNFLRPRARRAARTLRPPFVAIRVRKPWRRLRTNLLGW